MPSFIVYCIMECISSWEMVDSSAADILPVPLASSIVKSEESKVILRLNFPAENVNWANANPFPGPSIEDTAILISTLSFPILFLIEGNASIICVAAFGMNSVAILFASAPPADTGFTAARLIPSWVSGTLADVPSTVKLPSAIW